jgi:hypothetical protein
MYFHFPTLGKALRATFSRQHFDWRHAIWATLFLVALFVTRGIVAVARGLDHVLFGGFRSQEIRAPLFVIGSPRSGTTLFHRLLEMDDSFTTTHLWHTISPAVSFYRLAELLSSLDRLLGGHPGRVVNKIVSRSFSSWEGIHEARLQQPEEDEQWFLYTFLTPSVSILFPFPEILEETAALDGHEERVRRRFMKTYLSCARRHLFASGRDKTLLVKNTSSAGRMQTLLRTFPDARFVHLIRAPKESIPSLLSMYSVPWRRFVPQMGEDEWRAFADLYLDYYDRRMTLRDVLPSNQYVEVQFADLRDNPFDVVLQTYRQLGLGVTDRFLADLEKATENTRSYRSAHAYSLEEFGLDRADVRDRMADISRRLHTAPSAAD